LPDIIIQPMPPIRATAAAAMARTGPMPRCRPSRAIGSGTAGARVAVALPADEDGGEMPFRSDAGCRVGDAPGALDGDVAWCCGAVACVAGVARCGPTAEGEAGSEPDTAEDAGGGAAADAVAAAFADVAAEAGVDPDAGADEDAGADGDAGADEDPDDDEDAGSRVDDGTSAVDLFELADGSDACAAVFTSAALPDRCLFATMPVTTEPTTV